MNSFTGGKRAKKIGKLEDKIVKLREKANELRKKDAKAEVPDYFLKNWTGGTTSLSALFGGKKDLIVIHNMGKHCPYCTMWADGFNGQLAHLEDRAAFVVVSPDAPKVQEAFARARGWKFKMLSAHGGTFIKDMGFWSEDGKNPGPLPGVSTFRLKGGKIQRVSRAGFGPGDDFCPVWPLLDLLKDGADGWTAKFEYGASAKKD
jgi:predicted dithiol-disulfide oxidoreductase (DUF899 family)